MQIVVLSHPRFLPSESMTRFAKMIEDGMLARGHSVEVWAPEPFFYSMPLGKRLKKWQGYLDQFITFPRQVLARIKSLPANALFVFADQALGPWVPLVAHRPHVVHVHDFMALRSSIGEFAQNPTGWSGRQYQTLIRRGFGKARFFVSVSKNTRNDLHRFLPHEPKVSEVVYNGLNYPFRPMDRSDYLRALSVSGLTIPSSGFLLHVGGNQWYKNRLGVLEIYEAYANRVQQPLPIWMVGAPPTEAMKMIAQRVKGKGEVLFLTGLSNETVCAAYSAARLMIFPSLAEGFGWPIAEAMACKCLVLTTGEAPMTEVGGDAAFYVPRRPNTEARNWAANSGELVTEILAMSDDQRVHRQERGLDQAARFDTERTLDAYEKVYLKVTSGAFN